MKLYNGSTLITTLQTTLCNMYLCRFSTGDEFHVNWKKINGLVTVYFIYWSSIPCKTEGIKKITKPLLSSGYRG